MRRITSGPLRRWAVSVALIAGGLGAPTTAFSAAPMAAETTSSADVRSLMFSPAEVTAIRQAISRTPVPTEEQPVATATAPSRPNIYVSAVADFGDGQWVVWANGFRITPDRQPSGFHVVAVRDGAVDIVVDDESGLSIRLHPSQTWRVDQHDIVEGIFP